MAVRSLALLQLVKRTPFRRRHALRVLEKGSSGVRQSFQNKIRDSGSESTSAACHSISTFLLFLAFTFWFSSLSTSGRLVVLRVRGRPERRADGER